MTVFVSDSDVVDRPIRIFGSTRDDHNPISVCKAYVERLRLAGRGVELTEYPNASHAFHNPLGAQPAAVSVSFQSVRNCKIREESDGLLINVETKQPFTYKDAGVERGPTWATIPMQPKQPKQPKQPSRRFLKRCSSSIDPAA